MKKGKKLFGRSVIETIKDEFRDAALNQRRVSMTSPRWRDWLVSQGYKPGDLPLGSVAGWLRQAVMEWNREGESGIDHPHYHNGYKTGIGATSTQRSFSMHSRLRDTATRVSNDALVTKNNAARPDAVPYEIARVSLLATAEAAMQGVVAIIEAEEAATP